jgi:hypothetical protein
MTILSVSINRRRRGFDVETAGKAFSFPFAKCEPRPSSTDPVVDAFVDSELAGEAFTYSLRSGAEGSVHLDQVLEYNKDPSLLRDLLLYQLTIEAQKRVAASRISKREIIRRLGTSAAQLYRLLDQTNYAKSVDQVLRLLNVLDCDVEFVVHAKSA